ncbi:MAG: aromatic ring hydroxylase [Candidatus Dadabacteria bacterium]
MAIKKILLKKEEPKEAEKKVTITTFQHSHELDEAVELTEEKVLESLKTVRDPEIPVDIVNLGLIYDVRISGRNVYIKMTLTTPGCGMGRTIAKQAESTVKSIGAKDVLVEIVWDPPWNTDMMSDEARDMLGIS